MIFPARWPALIAAALLVGCAATPDHCLPLPEGGRYCLRPVQAESISRLQMVAARGRGIDERSLFQLENDGNSLRLAGMTPMGQGVMTVIWDGKTLRSESVFGERVSRMGLPLLALVQWMTLPQQEVIRGIEGERAYWINRERERLLVMDGSPLMVERASANGTVVRVPAAGMELTFTPLEQEVP